ncbi:MAG: disulfide oxidoreductase [Litorilinea sp.]
MRNTTYTDLFVRSALYMALAVAMVATLGSLYFSEVNGYVPCALCWYQRILMYPMVGIIIIGLLRMDANLPYYVLPFTLFGQSIATYHYLLQKTTLLGAPTVCRSGVSCITAYINWGGFITIPFLSMTAFFVLTILALIALTSGEPDPDSRRGPPWTAVLGVVLVIGGIFYYLFETAPSAAASLPLTQVAVGDFTPVTTPTPAAGAVEGTDSAGDTADHSAGEQLYLESCAACHGQDAQGVAGLGSDLTVSAQVQEMDPAATLARVRTGIAADDPDNQTGLAMPPSGGRPDLSDADILTIIDYLRNHPTVLE